MDITTGTPATIEDALKLIGALREELTLHRHELSTAQANNNELRVTNETLAGQILQMSGTLDEQRKTIEAERSRANEFQSQAATARDRAEQAQANAAKMEGYINRVRETDGIDIERRHRAIHGRRERDGDTSRRG